MGVTIIGIATKADEISILDGLVKTYAKWNHFYKAEFESEQYFEILINRKPDNNIVDIYSTTHGTIGVLSWELFEILSKYDLSLNFDFLYFDISETSMDHRFALFSQGKEGLCMNIWDKGSAKTIAGDNFLDIKEAEDIFFDVFPRAIAEFTPKPFHTIDLGTKIKRYRLTKVDNLEVNVVGSKNDDARTAHSSNSQQEQSRWWKFW